MACGRAIDDIRHWKDASDDERADIVRRAAAYLQTVQPGSKNL